MRKVIKVVAGFLVCLALLGIQAGCAWATGEQSVKELIGRDGEYLLTSSIAQELQGEVEVSGNVALLWYGSKVSFLERDASGFWNIKQEMEGYPQYQFSHMILSENTAIVNALRETEDGDYGALYVFSRNQDGIWRQPQKIEGYISYISGNIMVVGQRYYYAPSCSMKVYERDANNTWQEKQTISFKNEDASTIEKDLTTYYPGAIWNNCLIITSGQYGAFIFERDASGVWKFTKRLTDPDGQDAFNRAFGSTVLISGNDVFFPATNQGTFLFERKPDGNWQQKSRFPGYWLRISGNYALAEEDNALSIFERDQNGTWRRKQELTAEIGRGDQYYGIALKDNYAGFVSYRYSDYLSTNYVFERNPAGIWQLRFKTNPWDDIIAQGNLSFYNDGVVCSTHTANLYRLKLPDQFVIPNDKKYLVFKVERNASISSLDAITDKINFEAVGFKSDPDEPDKVDEVAYRLLLNKTRYMEGADAFYYMVDLPELETKYIEMCNKGFLLENPGVGYQMYQKVGLRIRYDSLVSGNNLKDVYVTEERNEVFLPENPVRIFGTYAVFKWNPLEDNVLLKKYQVAVTESIESEPNLQQIVDVPRLLDQYIYTFSGLENGKTYYFWIRSIDQNDSASNWARSGPYTLSSPTPVDGMVSLPALIEIAAGKPLQVSVDINISGQPAQYFWVPGDNGDISNSETPVFTYTYNDVGDYTLLFSLVDQSGQIYTATSKIQVRKHLIPHCYNAMSEEGKGTVGQLLKFEAEKNQLSNFAGDFKWNFGDGTPEITGNSVFHAFNQPGIYLVKVTAMDSDDFQHVNEMQVEIASTQSIDPDPTNFTFVEYVKVDDTPVNQNWQKIWGVAGINGGGISLYYSKKNKLWWLLTGDGIQPTQYVKISDTITSSGNGNVYICKILLTSAVVKVELDNMSDQKLGEMSVNNPKIPTDFEK